MKKVTVTQTQTSIILSEEDVVEILKQHFKLSERAEVNFNLTYYSISSVTIIDQSCTDRNEEEITL